jgi:hypothetical protein
MPLLDLYDQIVVTEYVRREYDALIRGWGTPMEEDRRTKIGRRILSMRNHAGRHVRIRYQDILGVGLAHFKAPGARPQLWTHKPNLRERFMEIVDVDEMTRWDPVRFMALQSPDPNTRKEAELELTDVATGIQQRNENRTDWMIWEALKGVMVVDYPNAAPLTINFGVPATHFPTFTIPWTDTENSQPVEDLWALSSIAIPAAGHPLLLHHMGEQTFKYALRSQSVRDMLSTYGRTNMRVQEGDFDALLPDGTQIIRTDDGYLDDNSGSESKALIKWIPDGRIFTTTPDYRYAGRPIGWTADGWVLTSPPNDSQRPIPRQGMQSEWIYDRLGQDTMFRQASARMPILEAPEAVAWGKAHDPVANPTF